MAKPKLALIPAAQGSKLYSVLPSSGVGDFDFTRSGSATRINSQGLIETVASGVSRLNYPMIDGVVKGCPHHILEPQRTQLIQYSEDFSDASWTTNNATISVNQLISPDGTLNADKITEDTSNTDHKTRDAIPFSSGSYTWSVFAKKSERNFVAINVYDGTNLFGHTFDLLNGNLGSLVTGSGSVNANIENYGNGWYRCSISFTASSGSGQANVGTALNSSTTSYTGDGTSGIYIWGAMLEEGSYSTSYIPNYGTAAGVTRSAETANGAGDAATFNDSEGVLMAEISALTDDSSLREIALSDGSSSNRLELRYGAASNRIQFVARSGGVVQASISNEGNNIILNNKIVIKYKLNDFALWVNGFELGIDNSGSIPIGLSELSFDDGGGNNDFYGNTKQIQYYDSALNDNELETLTSWVSFQDMAEGQLYTIE